MAGIAAGSTAGSALTTQAPVLGVACGDVVSLAIEAANAALIFITNEEEQKAFRTSLSKLTDLGQIDLNKIIQDEIIAPILAEFESFSTGASQAYTQDFVDGLIKSVQEPGKAAIDSVAAFFSVSQDPPLEPIGNDSIVTPGVDPKPRKVVGRFQEPAERVDCEPNLVRGSFKSVSSAVAGVVNRSAGVAHAAATTAGLVFNAVPQILHGAAHMNAEQIIALFTDRDVILDKISSTVDRIAGHIERLTEDHYAPNLFVKAGKAANRVRKAVKKLEFVEKALLTTNNFDAVTYARAEEDVADAEEIICSFDFLPEPEGFTDILKLIQDLNILQILRRALLDKQELMQSLRTNAIDFRVNLASFARADSLVVGLIDQVKCRLIDVVSRLEAAQRKNNALDYVSQQSAACLELKAIGAFMKLIEKPLAIKLPEFNESVTGQAVADIEDAAEALELETPNYKQLLFALDEFIKRAKISVSRFQEPSPIRTRAEIIKTLIVQIKEDDEGAKFESAISTALATLAATRATLDVITAALGGGDSNAPAVSNIVSAIRDGNWEKLFTINSVTSSIEGLGAQLVAVAASCCKVGDGETSSTGALASMLDISRFLGDTARRNAIFTDQTTMFNSKEEKVVFGDKIPKIKQRIGQLLTASKAPCFQGTIT